MKQATSHNDSFAAMESAGRLIRSLGNGELLKQFETSHKKMSKRFSDNDALCEDDESGRNILAPLFNAPVMASSTSNSMRESVESNVCLAESARATEHLIKLVERLRDLQRLVLPTQVVEAPDGQKAAQKGLPHLCDVAMNAVDNLEYMFEARFQSLNMMNRRLKEDLGQKTATANEHVRNMKLMQEQNTACMDEMEKDYLGQIQNIEDENEKLKLSIMEGNELLSQCQRALSLASQKSATLADQLDQSRVLQQHIDQENVKAKHQILVLQEDLSNAQQKCHHLESQFEDYSLASKYMRSSNGNVSSGAIPEDMKVMMRRCDSLLSEVKRLKEHNSSLEAEVSACRRKQLLAPLLSPSKAVAKELRASEDRMERAVDLAVEGDIAEIDVAESILRERLKNRQTNFPFHASQMA